MVVCGVVVVFGMVWGLVLFVCLDVFVGFVVG